MKLCECGCGFSAPIAKGTDSRRGWIKGKPIRFINGHNNNLRKGKRSVAWKGGVIKKRGRILIFIPGPSQATKQGYVYRSRVVATRAMRKPLPKKSIVHHFDEDCGNDENGNLVVCEDRAYHLFLHQRKRAFDACKHAHWRKCVRCKKYDNPTNLHINGHNVYHRKCNTEYERERRHKKSVLVVQASARKRCESWTQNPGTVLAIYDKPEG